MSEPARAAALAPIRRAGALEFAVARDATGQIVTPPSTQKSAPVANRDSSDAR